MKFTCITNIHRPLKEVVQLYIAEDRFKKYLTVLKAFLKSRVNKMQRHGIKTAEIIKFSNEIAY